jgi:hypothetical protein
MIKTALFVASGGLLLGGAVGAVIFSPELVPVFLIIILASLVVSRPKPEAFTGDSR